VARVFGPGGGSATELLLWTKTLPSVIVFFVFCVALPACLYPTVLYKQIDIQITNESTKTRTKYTNRVLKRDQTYARITIHTNHHANTLTLTRTPRLSNHTVYWIWSETDYIILIQILLPFTYIFFLIIKGLFSTLSFFGVSAWNSLFVMLNHSYHLTL
jgi:hypothetical protein